MKPIDQFITLVEDEKFEEAHEVLEHDWIRFKKEDKKEYALFYKGLINGATSIALIRRGRSQRARDVTWGAFMRYREYIGYSCVSNRDRYVEAIELIEVKRDKFILG
ncbi:MAG: DUF309 domain-containing protein [Campylobacterota bacterium]|nr:DUF309 domain-containing protein [Campylobacterota bacterium]